jgi:pimeloyl-ACP methyl ester carboxylesterase
MWIAILACGASLGAAPVAGQDPAMVAVDGHRMRVRIGGLNRAGQGQPVVVLESGLGARLEAWDKVFSKVSAFAPVLAYDRAGVGQSDSDGQPPTPRHVGRKLHGLLAHLDLKAPYVLVGHSWGGPLIRMFAGLYPEQVTGLVYVDPTDMRSEEEELAYYKARGYSPGDVPELRRRKRQQFRAYGAEMAVAFDLEDSHYAEFRALPRLPEVPVSVLMGARFDPSPWAGEPCPPRQCHDEWVRLRIGWLGRLARETGDGTFTLTTSRGHDLPGEDPDLVVWAIERVLSSARQGR